MMDTPTSNSKQGERRRPSSIHRAILHNPLAMSSVLQRIFSFLSVEDLKASRLVSHSWHFESTPELSTRIQPILLHDKVEWKKFLKVLGKSSTKMSKLGHIHPFHAFTFFSTYPEDPATTPYKTAILDYMHAKYRLPRKTLWDSRFFSTYGCQITELQFIQFNLYSEKALRELREALSSTCPQLTCLTLQFQKESHTSSFSSSGSGGGSTSSTSTPTPSPSPSPHLIPGTENVFFPPDETSQRKTFGSLKKFTFATDNKCFLNPHAMEEFMALMPSLEEFRYRYTGAKKQWTLVRRVDIIDILCNIINAGHYSHLTSLDLDSEGTVLSGEDFCKISKLRLRSDFKLYHFCAQVFIKTEPDWDYLCGWLCKVSPFLRYLDIQVRTHFPQLLSEQELPRAFPRVRGAKLLLDSNLKTFLVRMPDVGRMVGVYDNELLPVGEGSFGGCGSGWGGGYGSSYDESESTATNSSSSQSQIQNKAFGSLMTHATNDTTKDGLSSETEINVKPAPASGVTGSDPYFDQLPSCPSASHLRIQGNDEFGLDVEWKSRVFPNIQSFETDIYFDEDLRLIWLHMQGIRRLVLHLKTNVAEQAFTGAGIPPLTPTRLKGVTGDEDLQDEEHLAMLDEYPHLGLLTRLETLEIYSGARQDAYGSQFSASLLVYGVALLDNLKRLVLPPAIPPKCLEESLRYLSKLRNLTYLSVTDDTFNSVLPFHMLKLDLPNLEIVVRYYQPEIKRQVGNYWKLERFVFPDFLPERRKMSMSMEKRHSAPS